jgi:hypothetical protein
LETQNDQEVSSGSREKVATDVAGDKEGGIGTPKKRARATELQKLQVGMQSPQMPRKLRPKHYVEIESEKIGKKRPPKKGASKITKVRQ